MKIGSIVYQKKLIFSDGIEDVKSNRPCIYLYEERIDEKKYAFIIPVTSNVKRFNKDSSKYVFIPETLYNYRKFSFAKIDNILIVPAEQIIPAQQLLSDNTLINILKRLKEFKPIREDRKKYEIMNDTLKYLEPELEKPSKKQKTKRKTIDKIIY